MGVVRLVVEPAGTEVEVPRGTSLFEAARQLGIVITSDCGGHGECGKCFVRIRTALQPPTDIDRRMLPQDRLDMGARLSCQYRLGADTVAYIPPGKQRQNRYA